MTTETRKCPYCGGDTIIRPNCFHFRGVSYDLPYCKECNTIYGEDIDKIINAIRFLECQEKQKST
jgi:hypothetical protein